VVSGQWSAIGRQAEGEGIVIGGPSSAETRSAGSPVASSTLQVSGSRFEVPSFKLQGVAARRLAAASERRHRPPIAGRSPISHELSKSDGLGRGARLLAASSGQCDRYYTLVHYICQVLFLCHASFTTVSLEDLAAPASFNRVHSQTTKTMCRCVGLKHPAAGVASRPPPPFRKAAPKSSVAICHHHTSGLYLCCVFSHNREAHRTSITGVDR
jgi:hypothetical protein